MAKKLIKITLKRSLIGTTQQQRGTMRALGLRKINQSVEREDTPVVRGMLDRVRHMVTIEE
ncbi:MAG TPA: 50S ribosomal protein L30 [Anaerolineales bacterium]|jgi:large subunit ribosomal protein L30